MSASTRAKSARSKRCNHAAIWDRPTISPEELHKTGLLPLGRNGIYDACKKGEFEVIRLGKKIFILTGPLRRKLRMETG